MTYNKISPLKLFIELRKHSFHLTPDDYMVFLDAVCKGVLISIYHEYDYNKAVTRLCKALWVKSIDNATKFDQIIETFMFNTERGETHPARGEDDDDSKKSPHGENQTGFSKSISVTIKEVLKKRPASKFSPPKIITQRYTEKIDLLNYEKPPEDDYHLYFPASSKAVFSCLSKLVKPFPKKRFDVDATIQRLMDNGGKLIEYCYSDNKIQQRQRKMCMMVDQSRSMRPFRVYTQRIINVAKQINCVSKNSIVFFENTPDIWIYTDESMRKEKYLKQFLQDNSGTKMILISDAGYARGDDNEYRLKMTRSFYNKLKAYNIKAIWINPLPRTRWFAIGMIQVDDIVPMVEMSEPDLQKAVRFLNEE